jgi:hypothetical protein
MKMLLRKSSKRGENKQNKMKTSKIMPPSPLGNEVSAKIPLLIFKT